MSKSFWFLACGLATALCLSSPASAAETPPAAAPLAARDAALLLSTLQHAPDQGFAPGAFGEDRAQALLNAPDPRSQTEGRAQLVESIVAYAQAQRGGRIAPARFPDNWAIRPAPYDAREAFAAALDSGQLPSWVATLPPSDPTYGRLLSAYARYRQFAARGGWPLVAKPLKPGDSGPAVADLLARLAIEDPAVRPTAAEPVYDDAVKAAVARAQDRYGLATDGVAGRATLAALNMSAADRAAQIEANLERLRWMPRALPDTRAELNIADASLVLWTPRETPLTMRVIVGQPKKPTPMFQDRIDAVVLNPPWNVPNDIAKSEIWPKIRKDPGYQAREGFVVKPNGGLQQLPGPRCALGAIKFDLSNPFGVYLHDTPARSLFAQNNRALSHGCMRLEQPNALAKRLLRDDPKWPPDAIDVALLTGHTERVALRQPTPVYVAYWTVLVAANGDVAFRRDVYGWDKALLALLQASPRVKGPTADHASGN